MESRVTLLKHEDLWEAIRDGQFQRAFGGDAFLFDEGQVGEASIDLRLGTEFLVLRRTAQAGPGPGGVLCRPKPTSYRNALSFLTAKRFWLHPGHFMLAATLEYLRVPDDLGAYVLGRSSWGRVGLIVATAIMVQPGFKGCLTLELVNDGDSPIKLYPGARIAQLAVHTLDGPTARPYGPKGKYEAPIAPQASRLAKEGAEARQFEQLKKGLRARMLGDAS